MIIALFVGTQSLGRPAPSGVGGAPSATPSPTATPSPVPSGAAPSSATDGFLPEGPFTIGDVGAPVQTTVTIPASGWTSEPAFESIGKGVEVDASDPVDVTVGGYAGNHITLHVPNDPQNRGGTFVGCDQENFASYGEAGGEPSRYHQGPGQIDELWILDLDGAFVVLDATYRPNTPAELVEELRSIATSATFEAP